MRLSQRMARLGTETAFEVLVRARALEAQGRSVVHLEIGEPDFDTPPHITEAAVRALKAGATHYGRSAGLPELRQAVAEDSTRRRGVRATPEMVVVTPGAKPIMFFVILALVDEGDEVLYPNPGFPIYESMIRYIGGNPVPVRLLEEKAFGLDVGQLCDKVCPRPWPRWWPSCRPTPPPVPRPSARWPPWTRCAATSPRWSGWWRSSDAAATPLWRGCARCAASPACGPRAPSTSSPTSRARAS